MQRAPGAEPLRRWQVLTVSDMAKVAEPIERCLCFLQLFEGLALLLELLNFLQVHSQESLHCEFLRLLNEQVLLLHEELDFLE